MVVDESSKRDMVAKPWNKLFKRKKIISKLDYFPSLPKKNLNQIFITPLKKVVKLRAKKWNVIWRVSSLVIESRSQWLKSLLRKCGLALDAEHNLKWPKDVYYKIQG